MRRTSLDDRAWLAGGVPDPQASLRIFCLPYAGGGAGAYSGWLRAPIDGLDICPVQFPGRETRFREPPFRRMPALVDWLEELMAPWLGVPYAVFGHSMGALIGYELLRRMAEGSLPPPHRFFASAARPPHLPANRVPIHGLPEKDFLEAIREFNGLPEELLAEREYLDFALPILRADFELCETYDLSEFEPLNCPLTAYGGTEDQGPTPDDLRRWSELAGAGFECHLFRGGHFYLREQAPELLSRMLASLGLENSGSQGAGLSGGGLPEREIP